MGWPFPGSGGSIGGGHIGMGGVLDIPTYGSEDAPDVDTDTDLDDVDELCCIAGTMILTDRGVVPIEAITLDTLVCSWNYNKDDLKEPSFHPVIRTFISKKPSKVITLTTSSGQSLTCSKTHPIFVPEYGTWAPADNIDIGELVVLYGDRQESIQYDQIVEIDYLVDEQIVYNFSVKEAHTYVANGILTHNLGTDSLKHGEPHPPLGPTSGGGEGTGGLAKSHSDIDVEWMYGPTVTWVSSAYDDPTTPSSPWTEASEYPEGDYTEIQLKSPDSALRNGAFERIDPLIRFGMTQDTPDIIAMFDLHATEIDQESTYESSPDSGTPYLNAGDILFSNGPSKLLRMQIMSGIFLRANINSLFAVFQVENANAPGSLSATDWLSVPSSFFALLCYVDATRRQAARLFTAYAAQTSRNLYIRTGLQMVKSIKSRNLAMPASYLGSSANILRSETLDEAARASMGSLSLTTIGNPLGKYSITGGISQHLSVTPDGTTASSIGDYSGVGSLAAPDTGAKLSSLFERLKLPNRFKRLSETAVFIQLLQEIRRMTLDGSYQMTGPPSTSRSIDSSIAGQFVIKDDREVSQTTDFVERLIAAQDFMNGPTSSGRWGSVKDISASGGPGSASGVTIGGIIPRGEGGTIGSISVDDLNYQLYSTEALTAVIDNIPRGYSESLPHEEIEELTFLCHFLNREFIMSRRWKIDVDEDAVKNAQKFNSGITNETKLADAIDQVIGDSEGSINSNVRDIDSFAAALNPGFTETVDSTEAESRRMLPFELTDGTNYMSGYSTYINDLADSFINRESSSDVLKSESLSRWANEFGEKQENLSSFFRNLLMIGNVKNMAGFQNSIVSNQMFFRECCLSLCKFIHESNVLKDSLLGRGIIGDYPSPTGFLPTRYEQMIQLDIVRTCMDDDESSGFQKLEAYLRYRRDALMTKSTATYPDGPKWPDFGDFKSDTGTYSGSGTAGIGTGKEFGGGITGDRGAVLSADFIDDIEGGEYTSVDDVVRITIDDATYWWEDFYAAFAFAYPRFTQAASDLGYYYIEKKLGTTRVGSTSDYRCATIYSDIDAVGSSKTRYGLMQTPVGAALIEAHGEDQTGAAESVFTRMINTWDSYSESIYNMANDIETSTPSEDNQFTEGNFGRGTKSKYTENMDTWYRNINLDTCRMLTYFVMGKLIKKFVANRSKASIRIDGGTSLSGFGVAVDSNTGRVYSSLVESGDYETGDTYGSWIAITGHSDHDEWRFSDAEGLNVSQDDPFNFEYRIKFDAVEAPSFLISCLDTFGQAFTNEVSSDLGEAMAATWSPSGGPAYGGGGYAKYIEKMQDYWVDKASLPGSAGDHPLYTLGDTSPSAKWFNPTNWTQSFECIPAIVSCLTNEDIMIQRSLNAFSHVSDILNNRMALGQGLGTTSEYTFDKSKEYVEYLRKYVFGINASGNPDLPAGSVDLDDDEEKRLIVKSIFNSMNPDAVATAYAILCDNFTLSSAYINNLGSLPSPMGHTGNAVFDDADGTESYAHLIPASETISEANYAAIRWFQKGAKNKTPSSTLASEQDLGINKKIIVVGLPTGMLENLREKARLEEQIYREEAFDTSNFTNASLIRIRVIKKSHDNPEMVFTPRTFYFDTRYYYTDSGAPIGALSLKAAGRDTDVDSLSLSNLTPSESSKGTNNLLGVYSKSQNYYEFTNAEYHAIRQRIGDASAASDDLISGLRALAVERRGQDYDNLDGLVDDSAGQTTIINTGIKLVKFELAATADINASRNGYTNEFDYDIDSHTLYEAGQNIATSYSSTISGGEPGRTSTADPTLDFFGTNDTGDIGETLHGISEDPWAYDQRSGDYYKSAPVASSLSDNVAFGCQAAYNEAYSGILKHYIKMMTGFNVSERCFLNDIMYGNPMVQSPSLFTHTQNNELNERRRKAAFGDTDLMTTDLGITGTSISGFESPIIAAKTSIISRGRQYLQTAGTAVSDTELQSLLTMFYKTLPVSVDKYRNQGLLPKKFDRTFCILIDPEADFTAYNTNSGDDTLDQFGSPGELLESITDVVASDGLLYSFFVDVAIVPMDATAAHSRATAEGEDVI